MADHASVSVVVSDDDLLTEILLRLPAISLHLFKSVSKRWLSLINDTRFALRRTRIPTIDPPSGLFVLDRHSMFDYKFVSFDSRIPCKRLFTFTLGAEAPSNVVILLSCNGLLLCSSLSPLFKLYVYNPTVNQCKIIPQSPLGLVFHHRLKLVFDPTKSPYYKLIHAVSKYDNEVGFSITRIQIYFSKTGVWSVCGDWFPRQSFQHFSNGVFHNDAIHWINNWNDHQPLHYMLDIKNENPTLTNIQFPMDRKRVCNQKLLQSSGCLLLLGYDYAHHTRNLTIHEMRNGYSEWSLKYIVNFDSISTQVNLFDVCCIVLGEREEDSFMVIRLPSKIVRYRIMLKTLHMLCEHTTYGDSRDIQFIASYAAI